MGRREGGRAAGGRALTVQSKKWSPGSGPGEQGVRPGVFIAQETAALLQHSEADTGQSARQPRAQSPSRRAPPKPRARQKTNHHPRGRSQRRLRGDPPPPSLRGAPPAVDGAHGGASRPSSPVSGEARGERRPDRASDVGSGGGERRKKNHSVMMRYFYILSMQSRPGTGGRSSPTPGHAAGLEVVKDTSILGGEV